MAGETPWERPKILDELLDNEYAVEKKARAEVTPTELARWSKHPLRMRCALRSSPYDLEGFSSAATIDNGR